MSIVPTLLILGNVFACGPEVISEESGESHYVVDNRTSKTLELRFTSGPGSALEIGAITCAAGEECTLGHDSMIGSTPLPTNSLSSVSAWTNGPGAPFEVYRQEPVVNDRWTVDGKPAQVSTCCSRQSVVLTLTDADLTLP